MTKKAPPDVREVAYPVHRQLVNLTEYAAIHLRVENPDISEWLNEMIRKSRRDEFAKAALAAFLSRQDSNAQNFDGDPAIITKASFILADAMLKEDGNDRP